MSTYELVHSRSSYGVYRKTKGLGISYLIAKIPKTMGTSNPAPPSSALREFIAMDDAIAMLDRWSATPVPPPALTSKTVLTKYQSQAT